MVDTESRRPKRAPQPGAPDQVDVSRILEWAGRQDPVRWVLAGMLLVWTLTFFLLCRLRQDRFGTFAFDLGTYDQAVWLLAHFKMFDTVRGLNVLGHHMNLILLLLAPFYRLGAGPNFLAFVQVAAQASGGIAVYLLARDRLADRWLAVALAAVLLLNPTYQFLTWEFFHPDSLAIAPLLFAYWAARSRRWGWFALSAALACACKEDAALAVGAIGLIIAFKDSKLAGSITAAASGAYYLIATQVVMRHYLNGLSPFYDSFFGDLGNGFFDVLKNTVIRPNKTLDLATRSDRISYYRMVFSPFAFLPLASPSTLLVAVPLLAVNALTTFPYARDYMYHYSALVVAGLMVATVEAIAKLGRGPSARRFLVGVVAATSLATSVAWGVSPISVQYHRGYWPLASDPRTAIESAAMKIVPPQASVSATYMFVPHLTHRTQIYNFPEPWTRVDWGVNGEGLPDPSVVRWIAVDMQVLSQNDKDLVNTLLQSQFTTRFNQDNILVAQRTAPGGKVPYGGP